MDTSCIARSSKFGLNVISWNVSSLNVEENIDKVDSVIQNDQPDILVMQEVNLHKKDVFKKTRLHFIGYTKYYTCPVPGKPIHGLMTLVKDGIPSSRITKTQYEEPVECLIITTMTADGRKVEIQNIYVGGARQWTVDLIKHTPNHEVMYLGDFNAWHRDWNCPEDGDRGRELASYLSKSQCRIVNTDTTTSEGGYNIDLCIADPGLAQLCTATTLPVMSDVHYPVKVVINTPSWHTRDTFVPKYSYKKADWPAFTTSLDCIICNINWPKYIDMDIAQASEGELIMLDENTLLATLSKDADAALSRIDIDVLDIVIEKAIKEAANASIPMTKFHDKPWRNWYWNEELEANKKLLRKLHNRRVKISRLNFSERQENLHQIRTIEAKNKVDKDAAKSKAWNDLCENIILENNDSATWQKIRNIRRGGLPFRPKASFDAELEANDLINQFANRTSCENLSD